MNRKFTKDEAQRIFSLAAERQQTTLDEDTNQLSIADLIEAGVAAGIDPAFISEAASDLLRPDRTTEQRKFLGFPIEFRESHILPVDFTEENWKKSVDIFTLVYGKPGKTIEVGTTHRWSSEQDDNQMPAHIIAEKEERGTRFTIERKMWPLTLGLGIGAAVNVLIGIIFLTLWLTVDSAGDLVIPGSILTGIGFLLGLSGTVGINIYSRLELKRFAEVFKHLEELSENQQLMDSASDVENELIGGSSTVFEESPALPLDNLADSQETETKRRSSHRRKER